MSFGAELKDFASGFKAVKDGQESQARTDYYAQQAKKAKEGEPDWTALAADPDAIGPGHEFDTTQVNTPLHNLGHWLGLNTDERDKPKAPVAIASSPVAATSAVQAIPLDAYDSANSGGYDSQAGYSRGGMVRARGYAEGGLVQDDQPDQALPAAPQQTASIAPTPPPAPAQQAVPTMNTQMPATPPDLQGGPAQPAQSSGSTLGDALHGGIMKLTQLFGLDKQGTAVGPDPQKAAGQKALMSGVGAVSPEDYQQAAKAVDPNNQLTGAERTLKVMTKGYEWYLAHGEIDKANNLAASVIQYSTLEASKFGSAALKALQKGDIQGAAQHLQEGYNAIPDGKHADNVKVNPDSTVTVQQIDTETGKPLEEHTMTGQQLYQAALGLQNKTASWQAIMGAASASKKIDVPQSDAYTNAMMKLGGANPDGSLQSAPAGAGAGVGVQAPAAPAQSGGQSAPVPQNYKAMMAKGESGGNPNARNGDSVGLFQIQSAAWKDVTGHDPVVNGVDERLDPKKNEAVFDAITQKNTQAYRNVWGKDPSPGELAVMHQQGASGGMQLLRAAKVAPNTPAVQLIGNPAKLTGNGMPANATAAQVVQHIQGYYQSKAGAPGTAGVGQSSTPAPGGDLTLQPTLPEDQVDTPDKPTMPTTPTQLRADPRDLAGMQPKERQDYIKAIAAQNLANQKKFGDDMQTYRAAAASLKKGATKDPFALSVKDRNEASTALTAAKPDPADKSNPINVAFAALQPATQKSVDDVAYGLYTHNDTTAARAYQAAISMMAPKSLNFTPHAMPDGNVRLVFRTGDKMIVPKNVFDEMAAARGNELYAQRKAGEPGPYANLPAKAVKAVQASKNIAKNTAKGGLSIAARAANVVNEGLAGRGPIKDAVVGVVKTAKKIPRALDLEAVK